MKRMSAQDCGEMAFDALGIHLGGLNRRMWRFHSGLNESQLRRGIDWLRELFDDRDAFLRLRRDREYIYTLHYGNEDVREYMERRLHQQITRARRDYNEAHAFAKKHPARENVRQEEMARRRVVDLNDAYDSLREQ